MNAFITLFSKYLVNACHILGAGDMVEQKYKNLCCYGIYIVVSKNKQYIRLIHKIVCNLESDTVKDKT